MKWFWLLSFIPSFLLANWRGPIATRPEFKTSLASFAELSPLVKLRDDPELEFWEDDVVYLQDKFDQEKKLRKKFIKKVNRELSSLNLPGFVPKEAELEIVGREGSYGEIVEGFSITDGRKTLCFPCEDPDGKGHRWGYVFEGLDSQKYLEIKRSPCPGSGPQSLIDLNEFRDTLKTAFTERALGIFLIKIDGIQYPLHIQRDPDDLSEIEVELCDKKLRWDKRHKNHFKCSGGYWSTEGKVKLNRYNGCFEGEMKENLYDLFHDANKFAFCFRGDKIAFKYNNDPLQHVVDITETEPFYNWVPPQSD